MLVGSLNSNEEPFFEGSSCLHVCINFERELIWREVEIEGIPFFVFSKKGFEIFAVVLYLVLLLPME